MPRQRRHSPLTHTTLLALALSLVTGVTLGIVGHQHLGRHAASAGGLESFEDLQRVVAEVRASYVDPMEEAEIVENAIRGILDGLDTHSSFLDRNAYQALSEQAEGRFGGVGMELGIVDGAFEVIAPIDDTPAARAGISAGDRLTEIDGEPVTQMSLAEIVTRLRGEPGSQVRLGIERDGDERRELELTRAMVEVESVRSRMLESGIGYVRIAQFQRGTEEELGNALATLAEAHGPLAGLILDLRDNPGGVLESSVTISDAFLSEGLILYTEGRRPTSTLRYNAGREDLLDGAPLAVLVNRGSASAAEIVAGALQDHGRAIIVGSPSFGKGSVQRILPLADERAIKLTTSRYFTPSGRSIEHEGIEPDVTVDEAHAGDAEDAYIETALARLKLALAQGVRAQGQAIEETDGPRSSR